MTVLIVDDEPLVRETLLENIEWSKLHIDKVLVAEDGNRALETMRSNDVDLVISDIVMPNCSGLEMVELMHSMGINIPVILISGYCDKENLLKAIHLGVVDFIEKPISLKNVTGCVSSVVRRIKGMDKGHTSLDPEGLSDVLATAVRSGKFQDVDKQLQKIGELASYDRLGIYVSAPVVSSQYREQDLCHIASTLANRCFMRFLYLDHSRICILILFRNNTCDEVNVMLESLFARKLVFGFSSSSLGMGTGAVYVQASMASGLAFYGANTTAVLPYHDHCMKEGWIPIDEYTTLLHADRTRLKDKLSEMFSSLRRHRFINTDHVRNSLYMLHEEIARYYTDMVPPDTSSVLWKKSDFMMYLLSAIERYVFLLIDRIDETIASKKLSIAVLKAEDHIRTHYMDPHLDLPTVAAAANVSVPYLCKIFKRETGLTVNQFIQDFRLEKAASLLESGQHMVWEIAQAVGFDGFAYFSKLFKKKYGCLPSKFRMMR